MVSECPIYFMHDQIPQKQQNYGAKMSKSISEARTAYQTAIDELQECESRKKVVQAKIEQNEERELALKAQLAEAETDKNRALEVFAYDGISESDMQAAKDKVTGIRSELRDMEEFSKALHDSQRKLAERTGKLGGVPYGLVRQRLAEFTHAIAETAMQEIRSDKALKTKIHEAFVAWSYLSGDYDLFLRTLFDKEEITDELYEKLWKKITKQHIEPITGRVAG